jgi:hypothetical protein
MGRTKSHAHNLQAHLNRRRQYEIREYIRYKQTHLFRKLIAYRIAKFIFIHYILPKRQAKLNKSFITV